MAKSLELQAQMGPVFDITLEIKKVGTKSISYEFRFSKDDRAVATGTLVVCCCLMGEDQKMVPIPIPESYKSRLLGA